MSSIRTRIVSTGMYVPPKVVTNFDLEKMIDTTDEWIQQRSGIKERRWAEPGETTLGMAVKASKQALERAKLQADDIDMIIFGALMTDYLFPGTGVLVQRELGFTKNVPALDIRNQCAGFVYALNLADAWIRSGMHKRILIIGSELQSTSLNISDEGRDTAVLFGDGAACMIVEATTEKNHIIDSVLHSEGKHAEVLGILGPSTNDFPRLGPKSQFKESWLPHMEGKTVFKNAVQRMIEVVHEILKKNNLTPQDLDFVVAHQANARINQMVLHELGIPAEKTHNTIDHYGNTTMATIPLTFDEAVLEGKVKRGDLVCFVAFGSGFVWGANLVRY